MAMKLFRKIAETVGLIGVFTVLILSFQLEIPIVFYASLILIILVCILFYIDGRLDQIESFQEYLQRKK